MVRLKKFRFDIILVSILVISLISWLVIWGVVANNKNRKAVISYNNEDIMTLDLAVDKEIELSTLPNGQKLEFKMIIIVKDNKIWVDDSECPNHDCIREGKKSKVGDVIVCLPNKIIIRIEKL